MKSRIKSAMNNPHGSGKVLVDVPADVLITPLGVGVKIPLNIKFEADVNVSATILVRDLTQPNPQNVPQATLDVEPGVDIGYSVSVLAQLGFGLQVGAGATDTIDLPWIRNLPIEAGKDL